MNSAERLLYPSPMAPIEFRKAVLYVPFCPICDKPVPLESAKTDEDGKAIHEDCYVSALKFKLKSCA